MKNQQELTASAARRRSFAAAQKKGADSGKDKAPSTPSSAPKKGATAELEADNSNQGGVLSYGQHAAHLVKAAHAHGHPRLAAAITSAAHTPHPADKTEVARNYLATLPDDTTRVAHAAMFTPTLMGRS